METPAEDDARRIVKMLEHSGTYALPVVKMLLPEALVEYAPAIVKRAQACGGGALASCHRRRS